MKLAWPLGLEGGVVFREIDKCRNFNLMESNLQEIVSAMKT